MSCPWFSSRDAIRRKAGSTAGEFRTERNPSPIDSGGNSVGEEIGTKAYQIGAEDAVEIAAPGFPEFTGQFPVNEEGHIILKDIGMRLYVEGMTEVELEALLRDRISAYVKGDPALLVNVTKAVSRKYYVMGAVESQGEHTMGRRTVTVRDALLTSGWMGENAALTRVHLIRPSAEKPDYTVVDANAILYHGRLRDNLEVKPGISCSCRPPTTASSTACWTRSSGRLEGS